jgi:hypothetical protein
MYAVVCTRIDIAWTVRELARFMADPGEEHWKAVNHVLRYLAGTPDYGIVFGGQQAVSEFRIFSDSDWGMGDDRKSISGFVVDLNGPISWSSKQQAVVALSSCEAEYLASTHAAKQTLWTRNLLEELGFPQLSPSILFCDNQGTIACAHDPTQHSKMKHINIREHFIRCCVNDRIIDIHHIPGIDNIADLLTKPLDKVIHSKWVKMLRLDADQGGVLDIDPAPLE